MDKKWPVLPDICDVILCINEIFGLCNVVQNMKIFRETKKKQVIWLVNAIIVQISKTEF